MTDIAPAAHGGDGDGNERPSEGLGEAGHKVRVYSKGFGKVEKCVTYGLHDNCCRYQACRLSRQRQPVDGPTSYKIRHRC